MLLCYPPSILAKVVSSCTDHSGQVIASYNRIYATGGFPVGAPRVYREPLPCVIISAAGAQFEMTNLEWQDFLIEPESEPTTRPLFPHYYPHTGSVIPTFSELEQCQRGQKVVVGGKILQKDDYIWVGTRPLALNARAFLTSMAEDVRLILAAFDTLVKKSQSTSPQRKLGLFKATALGMGFFARNARFHSGTIAPHLAKLLLTAYETVLKSYAFPHIAVIEFPDFMKGQYSPRFTCKDIEIRCTQRDVLDFTAQEAQMFVLGVLNAGDCFCIPGNEPGYQSVEAMIGNNTDLRIVQAYYHNPQLLDKSRHIGI